jgi:hypothetical protein
MIINSLSPFQYILNEYNNNNNKRKKKEEEKRVGAVIYIYIEFIIIINELR